ncbi:unnamed protein product [Ixodes hexagonus]
MANRSRQDLKDDDLRRKLKDLGEDVGPITDTTRAATQRRLSQLLQNGTTTSRRSLPSRASLGRLSSDDSDGEASGNQRLTRRRSAATPSSRSRRTSPPERPRRPEPPPSPPPPAVVSSSVPSLRSRVGYAYSDEFSDTDTDVPRKPLRSAFSPQRQQPQQQQRYNHSLLVHRSDDTARSNGFVANLDQRPRYQWVSFVLLLAAALFFLFLGAAYMGVRYPSQSGSKPKARPRTDAPYNATLCEQDRNKPCIWEADVPAALELAGRIQRLLGDLAGKHECGEAAQPSLSYEDCLKEMRRTKDTLLADEAFKDSLLLLFENPAWGIVLLGWDGEPMSVYQEGSSVLALRALRPVKSYWCFIRLTLQSVAMQMALAALAVVGVCALYYLLSWYKVRRDERRRRLYGLVEKITAILREHAESPDCREPYLAQVHVRDMLIEPSRRKQLSQLWQDAVDFLGRNESRVRTERQHIDGESYLVWRWLGGAGGSATASPSSTPPRTKVWQGRAFESPASGVPCGAAGGASLPYVPATCLKIRNMFDLEVECEDDWPVQIRNAILEKCEGNQGIVHLQVDTASKEGCVYMKCASLEAAGQAYRALHGSWFDGNLITVKYLRLERYHERFPESQYCREPLKPSNSLRLSLDASNCLEEDAL